MKYETLVKRVKVEAKALKENATKKELGKLDFRALCPYDENLCIYGQATGSCYSDRAMELKGKCLYSGISSDIQGIGRVQHGTYSDYSPIEIFIAYHINQYNGNNEALINYLKGKTDTLRFKHK